MQWSVWVVGGGWGEVRYGVGIEADEVKVKDEKREQGRGGGGVWKWGTEGRVNGASGMNR